MTGIIPQPNEIEYLKGSFTIGEKTAIAVDDTEDGRRIAEDLRTFLQTNFDLNLAVSTGEQENAVHLTRSGEQEEPGAYSLTVSGSGVLIKSGSYQGLFYGVQTLKQMLTPQAAVQAPELRFVSIKDAPEFQWRGMMLDVSRHFFPKDSVKKVIDILAMHKMNKLHWHLVDGIGWRIEIEQYPELTKRGAWRKVKKDKKPWEAFETTYQNAGGDVYGGYYTKDDIREIVAYAADRYIDVIPEIEMPGHSEAALQCYPQYICDGVETSGVYCAGNDGTFDFLQNIISEVVELFPNEYLHIGGDEVGKGAWLQCRKCKKRMREENLRDGEELQSYFVKRMEQFIHSKNRKLIGWDEILEGGLPERATVMSWRGVKGGIEAANAGHDVVMSPGDPCYFDHSQGKSEFEPPSWGGYNNLLKVYDFDPVPKEIAAEKRHHILGGQANLWTEQIQTLSHVQYMMLPRICALSEALWTAGEQKNKRAFIEKMDFHFDRLQALGYNFAGSALSPDYEVSYDKPSKTFSLALKNELNLYEIRYTLDGSTPSMNSELYTQPIRYTSPIQLNAQCFRKGRPIGFPLIKMFSTGFGDLSILAHSQNAHPSTYLSDLKKEMQVAWPKNRTINIVFHGHSVPAGYFKTPDVNTLAAYPALVLEKIKAQYPFAVVNVIVTAIGGENAEQGAQRFDEDVLPHQPDVLFIDYGLNDRGLPLETSYEAWSSMIRKAKSREIKVMLLTPSPDQRVDYSDPNNELKKQTDQIIRLAEEHQVGLADSYQAFEFLYAREKKLKKYMSQVNHPNERGHELIADEIIKWFQ